MSSHSKGNQVQPPALFVWCCRGLFHKVRPLYYEAACWLGCTGARFLTGAGHLVNSSLKTSSFCRLRAQRLSSPLTCCFCQCCLPTHTVSTVYQASFYLCTILVLAKFAEFLKMKIWFLFLTIFIYTNISTLIVCNIRMMRMMMMLQRQITKSTTCKTMKQGDISVILFLYVNDKISFVKKWNNHDRCLSYYYKDILILPSCSFAL